MTAVAEAEVKADESDVADPPKRRKSEVTVGVPALVLGVVTAVLAVTTGVFGYLWASADGRIDAADDAKAAQTRAEQVAMDYAIGASNIDVKDFAAWVTRLKANTAPALATKFDASAPKLEQILIPLKWASTATPITAKVMSSEGGVYKVTAFLTVSSTSAQNPEGAQTTVTYDVTVDSNDDWKITDVGGLDTAVPVK